MNISSSGFRLNVCLIFMLAFSLSAQSKDWYPLSVDVWDPPFNDMDSRKTLSYVPLDTAEKPWKICVSIPHLKDAYWLVVNFALIEEAKRLGVRLRITEAGGYENLDIQRKQVINCMNSGADGLILSATNSTGLNDLIDQYHQQGKPVVDLINGIKSGNITARAAATYYDNAQMTADYLKTIIGDESKHVLWLPGPKGPAWAAAADRGFKETLEDTAVNIVDTLWGDTGKEAQADLITHALKRHKKIDFIIGTSVSSDAAVGIIKRKKLEKKIQVMAYYYDPTVHRNIARGYIVAAGVDKQALQARLAVDMMVRSLQGQLEIKHAAPVVMMVDKKNFKSFDPNTSIPPKGFRPTFSLRDWIKE